MKLPILVTSEVRALYNFLKRFLFIKPLKLVLLGYLWEYEQFYIARKAKHAVDEALNTYKPTVAPNPLEGVMTDEFTIQSRWTVDNDIDIWDKD